MKKSKLNLILVVAGVILIAGYFGLSMANKNANSEDNSSESNKATNGASFEIVGKDLKFTKADITEKASFFPYEKANNYMEVIAIKASDGSIRTALNTCQVCYDSGRGYYEQVGDTLVCQNCGNVFGVDDIEVIKGGCNPIPILETEKSEDDEFVTISGAFLEENAIYFENWK
jgi:hypothetical protein